jgi:hypothetical protein
MVTVALAHRFADDNDSLGVDLSRGWLARMAIRVGTLGPSRCIAVLAQPRSESGLDRLGIGRRELVFERKGSVRPSGESLGINELLELSNQLVSQVCGSVGR